LAGAKLAGKRVLITGAAGFVGRHLVHELLTMGEVEIRALVRKTGPLRALFPESDDRLDIVEGDLSEPDSLGGICEGVDCVFHCAALGMSHDTARATQEDYDRVNVAGSVALAKEALDNRVRRFVHLSSTAAMGVPHDSVVTEDSECLPSDPYQLSKRAAELALKDLLGEKSTQLIILRPCLVVGAGKDDGELLKLFRLCKKGIFPAFASALHSEKPLVSVKDLVRAMILASENGRPDEIYLIHSGVGHQLGKILEAAGELLGKPRPYLKIPLPLARLAAWTTTPLFRLIGRRPPLTPERLSLFLASRKINISKAECELGYSPKDQDPLQILRPAYEHYRRTGQL
jgi:nucleoside-diphosphate-sugar epimerase